MKKLLIVVTFFFLATISTFADEQKKIKLDDGHTKEQVRLGYCNVFVTRADIDDDENAKVTVEIENLDESNIIILFGHAYPEKELKKLSPSITFDKNFPGSKGKRNIDTYREARNVLFIEPSEKIMLPEISVRNEEVHLCRLPLYIAKHKDKRFFGKTTRTNKILLLEKQILELEIEVEVKPDEDFIRLEKDCNDLIEDISKQTFCTNSKHKPSLERQEAPYKERIVKIKSDIDEIISRHNWYTSDRGYQRYNGIKQKLDAIDFSNYEGDCGKKHAGYKPAGCKYCKLTPQQVYHKLDDYYQKIYSYNAKNRKVAKDAVMSDVNLLYNCAKHSIVWKNSDYKSKIIDRYNRINNF